MQNIYNIMEAVFPFTWIQYDFMKNALLAVLFITPLFGILGTMIVNNKMAFFSDALGHSALAGIGIGMVLGVSDTDISMIIFAVLFALLLNYIGSKNMVNTDTVISVFSSFSIALGLVILSKGGNFSKYSGLLLGDILSITKGEIKTLFFVFAGVIIFWCICFNPLLAVSMNSTLAKTKGIPVILIKNLFAIVIAIIVMLSIKWVGILLINALLILPAAASRNIAENVREYHLFSVIFSMFSGILGLVISYYKNVASGPAIVIIAAIIFFATYLYGRAGQK